MVPNGGGGVAGSTGGASGVAGSEVGGGSSSVGGAANSAGSAGDASAGAAGDGAAPRTIQISGLEDAFVDGCETGRNTGSDETLSVDSDPCVFAVFVKPVALSDIPAGATVESALLELQCTDAGNAVRVLRITGEWSEESVTWDTSPSIGDEIGSFEALEGPVFIDITELVTEWLEGAPIHGVALVQAEETDGSDYPSKEAGEANAPRIVVTYTP
ncbi:MAG: DNRLRE domain-containing protein [Myxococcota bacterium]|nr:DNRLRE domain-containing protein [Myxococcota bacterium]